jgi:hypothetical protein
MVAEGDGEPLIWYLKRELAEQARLAVRGTEGLNRVG